MARVEIPVQGMKCEGCERTLTAELGQLEGVSAAEADRKAGCVRVSFDPDRVDESRLRAQIAEAGYRPGGV